MTNEKWIKVTLIALLTIAIFKLPYEFYTFLRICSAGGALYLAFSKKYGVIKSKFFYGYVTLAVVYNPLIPLYLYKETWILINMASVIFIAISFLDDANKTVSEGDI